MYLLSGQQKTNIWQRKPQEFLFCLFEIKLYLKVKFKFMNYTTVMIGEQQKFFEDSD